MNIEYKVSPTFVRVHNSKASYIFIMGPVNSGKSTGCMFHLLFNAAKQKPDANGVRHSRYAVIRSTYPKLKSSTIKTFIDWFKNKIKMVYDIPVKAFLDYDLADGTKISMEILFVAIDSEQAAEGLRSWEFTGVWVNEAHEIPEYLVSTILPQRYGRYPSIKDGGCVDPFIIVDYNAVDTDHWLYRWAEEVRPANADFFRQPPAVIKTDKGYRVNPEAENIEFVKEGYYENICLTASPESINTDLMNNYGERKSGKAVYKDYVDTQHCTASSVVPPQGVPVYIGVDVGLDCAAVFTYQDAYGALVVFDEIVCRDTSLKEFCEDYLWPRIRSRYSWIASNCLLIADPAAQNRSQNDAKAAVDIFKENGFHVKLAKTNSPLERREAVTHFLIRKGDKFKLSDKCEVLRRGFISGYRYEQKNRVGGEYFKDKPEKNEYSHVHDALQYAALEYIPRYSRKRNFSDAKKSYQTASTIGGY